MRVSTEIKENSVYTQYKCQIVLFPLSHKPVLRRSFISEPIRKIIVKIFKASTFFTLKYNLQNYNKGEPTFSFDKYSFFAVNFKSIMYVLSKFLRLINADKALGLLRKIFEIHEKSPILKGSVVESYSFIYSLEKRAVYAVGKWLFK